MVRFQGAWYTREPLGPENSTPPPTDISRTSIPPVAPSGRFSLAGGYALAARRWWSRRFVAGFALGALLSSGHQFLRAYVIVAPEPVVSRALGVLLTATVIGLSTALIGACAELVGRVPGRLFDTRGGGATTGRALAFVALATWLSGLTAFHVVADGFLVEGGTELSYGALEFFANGLDELTGPVLVENLGVALGGGVLALILGVVATWWAMRRGPAEPSSPGLAYALFASGVPLSIAPLSMEHGALNFLRESTPELALSDSVIERRREALDIPVSFRVAPGPVLASEPAWRRKALASRGPRPNVLITVLESVSVEHVGYHGYERTVTPALDGIAARSVRFLQARTTATHSNYAQMAVLSSLFPRRFTGLDTYRRLDYPRTLWHDLLVPLGYATATISSQDERWQGMLRFATTDTPTTVLAAHVHDGPLLDLGTEKVVPDHVTREKVIDFIDHARGPWAAYVNFQSTHFPYKLPDSAAKPFSPWRPAPKTFRYLGYPSVERDVVVNKYDNALRYVDAQLGALRAHLERTGQLDDTLWIITSDHGELFHDHGTVTHGRTLFEGEARVPLLLHWPRRLAAADVTRSVSTLDVLPTLAELLEVEPHPSFQGQSLLHPDDERRAVFMNIQGMSSQDGVLCFPYKLVLDRRSATYTLYDVEKDPGETKDLYFARRQIAEALRGLLTAQMRAQLAYHAPERPEQRAVRYAPRMLGCPVLPVD